MPSITRHPQEHPSPPLALRLAQQAPTLLQNASASMPSYSLGSFFAPAESAQVWTTYENLILSCLQTGDEQSAYLCLERLTGRFGAENDRLMALRGLFKEAIAEDGKALQRVLEEYESILSRDATNTPVAKRRVALLRSLERHSEAIMALNTLLDVSPSDAEAWAELAELYVHQGHYQQGIFALEEVLLITPNAWNMHARLGEVQYITSTISGGAGIESSSCSYLIDSFRRFCRSIELCDGYLRGYYGLKLASDRLLSLWPHITRQLRPEDGILLPDVQTIKLLNQKATERLSEIIRRSAGGEKGWEGYDSSELITAREILNRDTKSLVH